MRASSGNQQPAGLRIGGLFLWRPMESNFNKLICDSIKIGATLISSAISAVLNTLYSAFGSVAFDRGVKIARVALAAVDTGGGVFSWANPEAGDIIVRRVILDVTTQSSGACTVDVGTTVTSGTTSSDNLIDGLGRWRTAGGRQPGQCWDERQDAPKAGDG